MKLDKKIEITDYATLIALVVTLVAAVFAFYFKNQQTELLKNQRQKDLLEIAKANENSELARKESEDAKKNAATAFENAANTNERAQKLELQIQEQKERAANAEKELLILKDKIKPRSVSRNNVNILINELKKFPLKHIMISSSLGDGEALSYATQFKNIFELAGWQVDSGIGNSANTGVGLYIVVKDSHDQDAGKLQNVFAKVGITLQGEVNVGGAKIQIFVGSKNSRETENN